MKPTKIQLFKRQITLSEIGKEGQEKLQNASVLVVGCGGLGSLIAVYLASSGIGKLHLVDFDTIDISNLHRQVFYKIKDVGKSKAAVLSKFVHKRAPFTKVTFSKNAVVKNSALVLVENFDIIVDATDSLTTKYLLNDVCVLKNKPLVYGSLYKFDGYVAAFNILQKDNTYSSNLRDAFPQMATDIPNCEEAGTLNSIVGFIATAQVNEVLKLVTETGKSLVNQLLVYNALENSQLKMKLKKSVSKKEIEEIFKNESYFDASCETRNTDWLIAAKDLKKKLSGLAQSKPILVSLIENNEITYPFQIDEKTTISKIKKDEFYPLENKKYIFICKQGNTSYLATKLIREKFPNIASYSLINGITNY